MMAMIGNESEKELFVDLFANSNGLPTIMLSEEEPLPSTKSCCILLKELLIWEKESVHHQPSSDIYIVTNYEYEDGSYDFRYFKLVTLYDENSKLVLITEDEECIELREHFEAFDESMLADD